VGAESSRPHNNKRQYEDRERMERVEQDLRAKLIREQEDRRHEDVRCLSWRGEGFEGENIWPSSRLPLFQL
jgi:hypothetical protein